MLHLDFSNLSHQRVGLLGIDLPVAMAARAAQLEAAAAALWARQHDPNAMLGWIALPDDTEAIRQVLRYREECAWITDLVVLGIGGSALGTQAVATALGKGPVRLHIVDNVEPEPVLELLNTLDPRTTLVNVISKSGSTAETMAAFLVFRQWLEQHLAADWKRHVVVTTDPQKGILRPYAQAEQLITFPVPPSVGGRFSVLSAVGTVPLAFMGVDLPNLLAGARKANQLASQPAAQNLASQTALIQDLYAQRGFNLWVLMPYSTRLRYLPDWFVQLHAESLGKKRADGTAVGTTPLRAVGATDQHAQVQLFREGPADKLITLIRLGQPSADLSIPAVEGLDGLEYLFGRSFFELLDAEARATAHALAKAQQPNFTLVMEQLDAYHLGWLLQHLMWQTALLGELWQINAFDQPGVELGKEYTYALMGRQGYEPLAQTLREEGLDS